MSFQEFCSIEFSNKGIPDILPIMIYLLFGDATMKKYLNYMRIHTEFSIQNLTDLGLVVRRYETSTNVGKEYIKFLFEHVNDFFDLGGKLTRASTPDFLGNLLEIKLTEDFIERAMKLFM
jgi:hypothetical protein